MADAKFHPARARSPGRGLVAAFALALAAALPPKTALADAPSPVTLGVGLLLLGGASSLDEPGESSLVLPSSGDDVSQPALVGPIFGAGLFVDVRALGVIGLEIDAYYARESLSGDLERNGASVELSIAQPALHVPVLLKGVLPIGLIAPFALVGPEFVVPGLSTTEVDPSGSLQAVAASDSAAWLTFGAGVECRLPLPALDLRIPIALRASVNPSVGDDLADRAVALPSDAISYNSTSRYRLALMAGLGAYF